MRLNDAERGVNGRGAGIAREASALNVGLERG